MTTKSPEERALQECLGKVSREMSRAVGLCARFKRRTGESFHPVVVKRAEKTARDLRRALAIVQGVGRITPLYDLGDPDLIPEDQKRARPVPEKPSGKGV